MKSGKRESVERIERPNKECFRTLGEKENYNYLGIFKVDTIKQVEIKKRN